MKRRACSERGSRLSNVEVPPVFPRFSPLAPQLLRGSFK
jgi:hypothetical protein